MIKTYKKYNNACKHSTGTIEAITLDGKSLFAERLYLLTVRVLAYDTARWHSLIRHFVTVEVAGGLFGCYWFDEACTVGIKDARHIARTLYTSKEAAMEDHKKTLQRYLDSDRWQVQHQF